MSEYFVNIESANRGRARLMLRLPGLRQLLRHASTFSLLEMFELYEVAATALEHFRHQHDDEATVIAGEYEVCCREIEEDICRKLVS